jgi:hypothetical protein
MTSDVEWQGIDSEGGVQEEVSLPVLTRNEGWVPHISLGFREMWDTTDVGR